MDVIQNTDGAGGGEVTLADLHAANIARQAEWCPDQLPDLSFRGNELAGETGEACNVIKKLERERHGWRGSRATMEQLAEELADVVICADLCAVTAGIDLAAAVRDKFNATSEKVGLTTKLAALASAPPVPTPDGRPYDKIREGLEDAIAFARGDASRGRIVHPAPTLDAGSDLQSDLQELLTTLGLGDHARPQSPHEVFQQALVEVRRVKARLADVEEALKPFAAILMNGEPVGPIPRGYLDRSLTRADLKRATALMRDPTVEAPRWGMLP